MRTLIKIRIGGGTLRDGLIPLSAGQMFQNLIAALEEHGGTQEDWRTLNPHIEVVGPGSTIVKIKGEPRVTESLAEPTLAFLKAAKGRRLPPKGREFVISSSKGQTWEYLEISSEAGSGQAVAVRLDAEYAEDLKAEGPRTVVSEEQLYAKVVRVGGIPHPTVHLEISGISCKKRSFKVASEDLARLLGELLFEDVRLLGEATWDAETFELVDFYVKDVDRGWRDVHLYEVVTKHDGVLPVSLTLKSTEELTKERTPRWEE